MARLQHSQSPVAELVPVPVVARASAQRARVGARALQLGDAVERLGVDALNSRGAQARDHVSGDGDHQIIGYQRPRIASVERHVRESDSGVALRAQLTDHLRRSQSLKNEAAGGTPAQYAGQVFGVPKGLETRFRSR